MTTLEQVQLEAQDRVVEKATYRPILCVDFDGVIHSYTSGWKGARCIPDPPVPGAIEWLMEIVGTPECIGHFGLGYFDVYMYSSRSRYWGGRKAMKKWLVRHGLSWEWLQEIRFPLMKPPAFLHVDDRCICFNGTFPKESEMVAFKPWYKR